MEQNEMSGKQDYCETDDPSLLLDTQQYRCSLTSVFPVTSFSVVILAASAAELMALVFVVVVSPVTSDTLLLPLAAESVLELETAGTCCFFSEPSAVFLSPHDRVSLV